MKLWGGGLGWCLGLRLLLSGLAANTASSTALLGLAAGLAGLTAGLDMDTISSADQEEGR